MIYIFVLFSNHRFFTHGGDPNAQDMVTLRFVSALKAFRAIRMVRSFRFSPGLRMLVKASWPMGV